jgi:hypothetical protein
MNDKERILFANVVLFAALCACRSTGRSEGAIDVESFSASGCNPDGGRGTSLADLGEARCVSWSVQPDGSVAVALSNFAELCGTPTGLWAARAQQDSPDKVSLWIEWKFETPNACGLCEQDYSLKLIGIQPERVKTLDISTRGCLGQCAWSAYELDLSSTSDGGGTALCGDSVRRT